MRGSASSYDLRRVRRVSVIDSHTEGEPTRTVVAGGPELGAGAAQARDALSRDHRGFCRGVLLEPRGSEVLVGALLLPPADPQCCAGAVFFNNVGVLGMCGHGTIGVARTLLHMGRIGPGRHALETPVGHVPFEIGAGGSVTLRNVPSRRARSGVRVRLDDGSEAAGDIAWGGNWFFIARAPESMPVGAARIRELEALSMRIQRALDREGLGMSEGGAATPERIRIDHVELWSPLPSGKGWRSFTLCPGGQWDRSPCGTGTSAKLACLAADGAAAPGEAVRAESPIGTHFDAWFDEPARADGSIVPSIRGRAWITAESQLCFDADDPCASGLPA